MREPLPGKPRIELRDAAAGYGRRRVFEGVTATARPGCVTALLGPNAAGKTTLLRCIAGALRCTSGAALVDGHAAHRLTGRALARRIAWVPQHPEVAAAFTVREVVELGRFALEPSPRRVDEAIAAVGLANEAERPFPALSSGQQQRAALARALAQHEPGGVLLLDEPVASMDLGHARQAFDRLRLCADAGATVVIVLHDLAAAAALADDAWILAPRGEASQLEVAGPVADVVTPERLEAVFGAPFEWVSRRDGSRVLVAS